MSTNEPMTQERLNEIQGRLDASTWTPEEPWHTWKTWGGYGPNFVARYEDGEIVKVTGDLPSKEDSRLIGKAPQDLADLLAEVHRLRALTTVGEDMVERVARELADLDTGEDWPSNHGLGGGPCGTRDDEFRYAMRERAREVIATALGTGEEA